MKAEYTPGPWSSTSNVAGSGHTVFTADGETPICHTNEMVEDLPTRTSGQPVRKANARLIASAPELAKALQEMLEHAWAVEQATGQGIGHSLENKAEAALAKAGLL